MNSSDRAKLRSLAMNMQPLTQIGKNGVTAALLAELDAQLESKELIKLSVLRSCEQEPKAVIAVLARELKAEPVQAVGRKLTLYRRRKNRDLPSVL